MDASQSVFKLQINGQYVTSSEPMTSSSSSSSQDKSNSVYAQAPSDDHRSTPQSNGGCGGGGGGGRHSPLHRRVIVGSLTALLQRLPSPSSVRFAALRAHWWKQLRLPSRQDVQRIVLSAVPYLLFLFFYGINPYTHVLPLAADIGRANLRNVSAWEGHLFPWQLHVVVSSVHFLPLDFLAAVPYLGHYAIPVLYPAFLYLLDRLELILQFYRLLGLTMWGHYVIWLVAPTLPPWALDFLTAHQKSNASSMAETILTAHKEGPAFARIDSFIGRPFFYGMFVGNPVPFGSFPSGHVAWPMCIFMTLPGYQLRSRFSVYVVWVAWATLYTGHHYVLDIIGALALVGGLARLMGYVAQAQQTRCSILPL